MAEGMKKQANHPCEVLIIGGGSAGLRAAIEAHDAGAHVLIISKSKKGDPHTTLARGGINAALGTMDQEDNWIIHAADTLREGEFLADYERVEALCRSAPDAIKELVNWGARFHREKDGRLTQRFFGAHTWWYSGFLELTRGGILLNSKGERFMKNYDPETMELGPRDVVARANYNEIISGRGTEH